MYNVVSLPQYCEYLYHDDMCMTDVSDVGEQLRGHQAHDAVGARGAARGGALSQVRGRSVPEVLSHSNRCQVLYNQYRQPGTCLGIRFEVSQKELLFAADFKKKKQLSVFFMNSLF